MTLTEAQVAQVADSKWDTTDPADHILGLAYLLWVTADADRQYELITRPSQALQAKARGEVCVSHLSHFQQWRETYEWARAYTILSECQLVERADDSMHLGLAEALVTTDCTALWRETAAQGAYAKVGQLTFKVSPV